MKCKTFFSVSIGTARGTRGYIFYIFWPSPSKVTRKKWYIRKPIDLSLQCCGQELWLHGLPAASLFSLFFSQQVEQIHRNPQLSALTLIQHGRLHNYQDINHLHYLATRRTLPALLLPQSIHCLLQKHSSVVSYFALKATSNFESKMFVLNRLSEIDTHFACCHPDHTT